MKTRRDIQTNLSMTSQVYLYHPPRITINFVPVVWNYDSEKDKRDI